jgi:hypothetical protein
MVKQPPIDCPNPSTTGSCTGGKPSSTAPSARRRRTSVTVAWLAAAMCSNVTTVGSLGVELSPTHRWSQLTTIQPRAACQPASPPSSEPGMSNV